ncbi:hypothetical protein OG21DRAFT_1485634 [Imleria badia]|nr:hypothetical protein OG21DRAFT_1485634 [Imleria badia]
MFSDPVSFNGGTRVEVIAVLANCGTDTDKARRALVTWIRRKQDKGRTTEHILIKLRDIESKFIKDTTLHSAFRDARAETFLPRAPDLPLPSFIRRKSTASTMQCPESVLSITMPNRTARGSISSSSVELPANVTQRTSPITPLHHSRDFSQSEFLPGKPNTSQRISLPQGGLHIPQSRSLRIQIPRNQSLQPGPSSPVTSSPEDSELHSRYRSMSHAVPQSNGLLTPVSASPSEFSLPPSSFREQTWDPRRHLSRGFVSPLPSPRTQVSRSRSQRSMPNSPPTSSSDEGEFHHRRSRPISQPVRPMSPSSRRVTPPRASPPDVPLPPIPSDDQDVDSDSNIAKSLHIEVPPMPVRSPALYSSSPIRPLPIQPIPSPILDDESEHTDTIGGDSLRENWLESNPDLPSDIVVRQDSPVYMFHDDHASPTGIGPPPPYVDQSGTYFPPDMPTIGDALDKAVNACGGSSEVRLVVSRCIEFHRGYEPPYWQTRLQACGLDAEAAKHLVDEMCKEVDWAASLRRSP